MRTCATVLNGLAHVAKPRNPRTATFFTKWLCVIAELAYLVHRLLKNSATKHPSVTLVTANLFLRVQTDLVMARRSFGVVLIVALLSWTVNRLNMGCESQHSRAAVVVLAGASPAYQPEPSPTRHNCCPRESHPGAVSSPCPLCHQHPLPFPDCCSISHETAAGLPSLLNDFSHPNYAFVSLASAQPLLAKVEYVVALRGTNSSSTPDSLFTILRL